jgi:hypothetical protein
MSHFDDNKYRTRKLIDGKKLYTKALTRIETIKSIAEWARSGHTVSKQMKFCQRNISPDHRKALLECAELWNKLEKMEKEVKDRAPRKNI